MRAEEGKVSTVVCVTLVFPFSSALLCQVLFALWRYKVIEIERRMQQNEFHVPFIRQILGNEAFRESKNKQEHDMFYINKDRQL